MTSNPQLQPGSLAERTGAGSTTVFQPDLTEVSALLTMSRAIATVRDPRSLFYVLMQQLKPLVPFDDLPGLFVLNEDQTQYRLLFYDVYEEASDVAKPLQDWASQPISVSDDPVSQHLVAHPVTQILSVADYQQQWPAHPGVVIAVSRGISETLHLPLWYGERLLGYLSLNAHRANTFSKRQFPLLSRIGDLLSIAVANILANEEILEREREKAILLEIGEAVSLIRDRKQLLGVVFARINPFVRGDEFAALYVFDKTKTYYHLWLEITPGKSQNVDQLTQPQPTANDGVVRQVMANEKVYTVTLDEAEAAYPDHIGVKALKDYGLNQFMVVPLRTGGELIGWFNLHSRKKDAFRPDVFSFFQSVGNILASAVANILANEEILEREREKTILLSLSEDISSIRSRQELFETIANKIKAIFNYYDCSLHVVDLPTQRLRMWFHNFLNVNGVEDYIRELESGQSLDGEVARACLVDQPPFVLPREVMVANANEPGGAYVAQTTIQEVLIGPLKTGLQVIGCFNLSSDQKGWFTPNHILLFKSVCEQVATAVANILANEEILEREQEKTILLSLSELMSKIRTRNELWDLIATTIKPIFNFDDAVITQLDWAKNEYFVLVHKAHSRRQGDEFDRLVSQAAPFSDSAYQCVVDKITKDGASVFLTTQLAEAFTDDEAIQILAHLGLEETLFSPLFYGERLMGTINFHYGANKHFDLNKLSLIRSLSDLMALTVANILANEEILEREQEKALELEIIQQFINPNNSLDESFEATALRLSTTYLFDNLYYNIRTPSGKRIGSGFKRNSAGVLETVNLTQFVGQIGKTMTQFMAESVRDAGYIEADRVLCGEALLEAARQYPLLQANIVAHQIKSALTVQNKQSYGHLTLGLLSKKENAYTETTLRQLRPLFYKLSIAIENKLVLLENQEREREKEQLLSITRSLSQVNTRQELYAQLTGTIRQLLHYDEVILVQCLENGDFFRHWVVPDAHSERVRQHPLYRNVGRLFPTAGTPYAQLYAPTAPRSVYWHINPARLAHQEYWGSQLCAETGICELLIIPLTNGHTLLGNIEFATRSEGGLRRQSVEFYENVAQQVAIVMGSILHNEALQQQTQERDLQLAVSNLLVKGVSVDELLLQLAPSISQVLLFDFLVICVPQTLADLQMLDRVVSRSEGGYQINDRQSYLQPPATGAAPETQPDTGLEFPFGVAACYTGDAFETVCAQFPRLRGLRQRQRVQSVLAVPLYVGGQPELMLVLSSRHAWAYVPTDLGLLTNLSRQMSLVLDKLLAIQQLESLKNRLAQENVYLQEEVRKTVNLPNFIGQSALMQQVFQKISLVAPSDFTVLIEGETGTGKELVARALHEQSRRGDKIMVKVNCAALPANLIESELFGHEKGAFTGAIDRRIGKFELAHGGTLFLDEIGELPLELQAKLLRVIQEKEIERVGGRQVIKVDVRVVAATNKKLLAEVEARRFRQDLFYRLCVFPIEVPPLRERTEDIPALAEFFARKASHHVGRKISGLAKETVRALQLYHWPGNVRELQHVMEHAVLTSQGPLVVLSRPLTNPNLPTEEPSDKSVGIATLANNERDHILRVLKLTGGRIRGEQGAAKLLDINPTTLESRMQKLNIRKKEFE